MSNGKRNSAIAIALAMLLLSIVACSSESTPSQPQAVTRVAAASHTPTPTPTFTPTFTSTPIPTSTPTPTFTPTPTPTPTETPQPQGEITILAEKLNVRSGPGTNYPVISSLEEGTVISQDQIEGRWGDWVKLRNGGWFYVGSEELTRLEDITLESLEELEPPPTPTPEPTPTPNLLGVHTISRAQRLPLFIAQNGSYKEVGYLTNQKIKILKIVGDWCMVTDDLSGKTTSSNFWVKKTDLEKIVQGETPSTPEVLQLCQQAPPEFIPPEQYLEVVVKRIPLNVPPNGVPIEVAQSLPLGIFIGKYEIQGIVEKIWREDGKVFLRLKIHYKEIGNWVTIEGHFSQNSEFRIWDIGSGGKGEIIIDESKICPGMIMHLFADKKEYLDPYSSISERIFFGGYVVKCS